MFNSMFDELKDAKQFKESYNVKFFKETKRLKSLQKAEANLEPKQAFVMELFYEYT